MLTGTLLKSDEKTRYTAVAILLAQSDLVHACVSTYLTIGKSSVGLCVGVFCCSSSFSAAMTAFALAAWLESCLTLSSNALLSLRLVGDVWNSDSYNYGQQTTAGRFALITAQSYALHCSLLPAYARSAYADRPNYVTPEHDDFQQIKIKFGVEEWSRPQGAGGLLILKIVLISKYKSPKELERGPSFAGNLWNFQRSWSIMIS